MDEKSRPRPGTGLRRAASGDAAAVTRIFRDSRAQAMPWLPVVRTEDDVVAYFAEGVLEGDGAWVFEEDGKVRGFAVLDSGGLHHLYVAPHAQRRGIGSALFRFAQSARPEGFEFWVFRDNAGARRFYEAHGARCLYESDGTANEEHTPDARYEWRPPS